MTIVTGDMHLRYYIGAPLISEEGVPLGALCVFDREPRSEPIDALAREGLEVLAAAVMRWLQSRRAVIAAETGSVAMNTKPKASPPTTRCQ